MEIIREFIYESLLMDFSRLFPRFCIQNVSMVSYLEHVSVCPHWWAACLGVESAGSQAVGFQVSLTRCGPVPHRFSARQPSVSVTLLIPVSMGYYSAWRCLPNFLNYLSFGSNLSYLHWLFRLQSFVNCVFVSFAYFFYCSLCFKITGILIFLCSPSVSHVQIFP